MVFTRRPNEETQKLVAMLDKSTGVHINKSNGKMSLNLSDPEARQKILNSAHAFYKTVQKTA
ncbi:hypothetical protein [Paludibacterium purpuratum]|uniref:Uncharacterized protein n=1 Tax=Paludibacterium purpuratum TaxID=1144873 RepID=A0A4V3DVA7_9NEIS|nr:hypothetical protein [Paludibacterium purpuratum]TDR80219.1 hypothetical protein DFP86_10574 [Paludibacterium purpuratum]